MGGGVAGVAISPNSRSSCGHDNAYSRQSIIYLNKDNAPYCDHREKLEINPLSPHDAKKHHFTSLKTDFIFSQLRPLIFISLF